MSMNTFEYAYYLITNDVHPKAEDERTLIQILNKPLSPLTGRTYDYTDASKGICTIRCLINPTGDLTQLIAVNAHPVAKGNTITIDNTCYVIRAAKTWTSLIGNLTLQLIVFE